MAGRLWGAMIAATVDGDSLPPDSERRLAQFIELVGTAIANTEARVEVARLADEQAALRRVATLVAQGAPPGGGLPGGRGGARAAPRRQLLGPRPLRASGHSHG